MVDKVPSNAASGPSLRERRRHETAELILDAVLDLVAEAGIDGLTIDAVAERVGVSLRTVYRYFPDRATLLTAALTRHNEAVPFEPPTSPDQIGAAYGQVFPRFDDMPAIVHAVLAARVAGLVRCDARSHRIREIEDALAPACDHLPRHEAEQATAVIVYLANALAWLSLRDESGLDGHQSGAAITWAIDTLIADLDRRNRRSASGRRGG